MPIAFMLCVLLTKILFIIKQILVNIAIWTFLQACSIKEPWLTGPSAIATLVDISANYITTLVLLLFVYLEYQERTRLIRQECYLNSLAPHMGANIYNEHFNIKSVSEYITKNFFQLKMMSSELTLLEDKFIPEDSEKEDNFKDRCAICLIDFIRDENLIITECEHKFHQACVSKWLDCSNNSCPLCKRNVKAGLLKKFHPDFVTNVDL